MATGTSTYMGLAMPLNGESQITGQTAATDILTITGASSQSGDYLVIENSAGTELFVINSDGDIAIITNFDDDVNMTSGEHVVLNKTDQTTFSRLRLPILNTAPSSAGLAKGDIWLAKATTDVYRLALCISTATGAPRYGSRITRVTLGSASH
jgi:hypothetical protein